MRIAAAALVPFLCFAQPGFRLRDYLTLTPEQEVAISDNNRRFMETEAVRMQRINAINSEIGAEMERPVPAPPYLGERYREIESICRSRQEPLGEHYRANMAVLDAGQRSKLDELESSNAQGGLILAAYWAMLVEPEAPRARLPFMGTAILDPFGFTFLGDLSAELIRYLELTAEQVRTINTGRDEYRREAEEKTARIDQVGREVDAQFGLPSPEIAPIGEGYREMEALRRQLAESERRIRAANLAALSEVQKARLASIGRNDGPSSALFEARSMWLLRPQLSPPASRASGVTVVYESSGGSAGFGSALSRGGGSRTSIYRACLDGPDYQVRIQLPSPLGQKPASREAR